MDYRVLFISSISISSCFKLLGLLCTLEDEMLFETVDIYCGIGLSSIITVLFSLNYTSREIIQFFYNLSFCNNYVSMDYKLDASCVKKATLFQNEIIRKISTLLIDKYDTIPTLGSYYIKTGVNLIFPVFNCISKQIEFLNAREHSDYLLTDCLLAAIYNPYNENGFKLDNYYCSCSIADKYPIYYFYNSDEIIGILCEVDTASRYMFQLHSNAGLHYLLERHNITELINDNITKLIADGYSISLNSNYKYLEFKRFIYPKYNFKNGG